MHRRLPPRFLVACGLVALAGCSRPSTPRLDYQAKTRAICADAVRQVRALPAPRTDAELIAAVRRLRKINRTLTNRIAVINPPPGDRAELRQNRVVDIGLRTDTTARELLAALTRSPQPRRELERRRPVLRRRATRETHSWAKGRLHACADGPSRALAELGTRPAAATRAAPPA